MTDFSARASDHINNRLVQNGRNVVYARGEDSVELTAQVGKSNFRFDDQAGASVVARSRDYLIPEDQLVLDGTPTEPATGDRITETINGVAKVFEVRSPAPDEPDWRYDDADRAWFRIHTREVKP